MVDRYQPDEPVFREVLDKYFGGEPDQATIKHLADS